MDLEISLPLTETVPERLLTDVFSNTVTFIAPLFTPLEGVIVNQPAFAVAVQSVFEVTLIDCELAFVSNSETEVIVKLTGISSSFESLELQEKKETNRKLRKNKMKVFFIKQMIV
jgi:hypothetical protein